MRLTFTLFILFTIYFCGCISPNKFLSLNDNTECSTTIEGYFSTPKLYKHFAPAVLFNDGYKYRYELGNVIEINEKEVKLVEKKYSFLHTPDTLVFDKSIVRAIIDSNYFCVYGDIKENEQKEMKLKFYLEKIDEPKYGPIYLELVSNHKFGYCVKPGKYILKTIIQDLSDNDFYYQSFPVFDYSIDALENRANFIGNINLINKDKITDNVVSVPFFKQVKSKNAGAAFGMIGGLMAGLYNESSKNQISGYYHFLITYPDNFITMSKNQINICPNTFIRLK